MIHQVSGCLGHAPRPASGAETAAFATEGHQLLMGAVFATQAQKTVGQNATIEKSIEFVFDKIGQTRPGLSLDLGEESLDVFLY